MDKYERARKALENLYQHCDSIHDDEWRATILQALSAREGFVLVPREPTTAMMDAVWGIPMSTFHQRNKTIWKAMLSAAPTDKPEDV